MKKLLWLAILITVLFSLKSYAASNSDPRFFGKYCGKTKVCQKNVIGPIDKCKDIKDIKTRLDYTESGKGGLVHGNGTAKVDGDTIHFSIAGVVVKPGVFRGSATTQGLGSRAGWAYLTDNGTKLTISIPEAEGEGKKIKKVELSKFACGNTPPQVRITSSPNAPVSFGQTAFFIAEASDAEDLSFPKERLVWKSDNIGVFDDGLSGSANTLPPGNHTITFSATDSGGLTSSATVQVIVINKPPDTPIIFSPVNGATITSNCDFRFLGQAYDPEDGFLSGSSLDWFSNVGGFKGTGGNLKTSLQTQGDQVITLRATDSLGVSSSQAHTVHVEAPSGNGCSPIATIVTPPHREFQGAMVVFRNTETGDNPRITFVGTAEDSEDTIEQLDLEWRVSPANCTSLATTSIGDNTSVSDVEFIPSSAINKVCKVSFKVRDSDGNTDSDEMIVVVLGQPIL